MCESMLERVARAIADANQESFDEMRNLHLALARAAIEAMRPITPDDEIWPTLDKARHDDTLSTSGMWAEVIDAALEGK